MNQFAIKSLETQVEDHEKRIKKLEVNSARLDERIAGLVQSTANLKWSIWAFTLILLLAVVYGAVGSKGFNQIMSETPAVSQSK